MKNWLIFVLLGFCSMSYAEEADLVLRNGTVITMDEAMPEASAVAVKGDRIYLGRQWFRCGEMDW
jgi:hypothetical protein